MVQITKALVTPILFSGLVLITSCGSHNNNQSELNIVGGEVVTKNFSLFDPSSVVRLITEESKCSGVVISPRLVATSAHCFTPNKTGDIHIHNWQTGEDRKVRFLGVTRHPEYKDSEEFDAKINDVALIYAEEELQVEPMAIWQNPNSREARIDSESKFGVLGYGVQSTTTTQPQRENPLKYLRFAKMAIYPTIFMGFSTTATACVGDSGGPVIITENSSTYLAAITQTTPLKTCSLSGVAGNLGTASTPINEDMVDRLKDTMKSDGEYTDSFLVPKSLSAENMKARAEKHCTDRGLELKAHHRTHRFIDKRLHVTCKIPDNI